MSDTVRALAGDDQPTTLYRLYDAEGRLLYVGIARDWWARFAQHQRTKRWWWRVANSTYQHYPDRWSALAAERDAITAERPRFNREHNVNWRPGPALPDVDGRWDWACVTCGKRVKHYSGQIYVTRRDAWQPRHRTCDGEYGERIFDVESLETGAQIRTLYARLNTIKHADWFDADHFISMVTTQRVPYMGAV